MSCEGAGPGALGQQLAGLGLVAIDFDAAQAVLAGELRERPRKIGVSFGDCCCIALALHRALPILSADRPWLKLGLTIQIHLIR
jgi:ribonuclease VapC